MRQWRDTHPRATFDAIAAAVDAAMRRVRAQLVTDVAQTLSPTPPAIRVARKIIRHTPASDST